MDIKPYLHQLVINPQTDHYHKIKDAVWLLLYLLLNCGSNTWIIVRDVKEIAGSMGVSSRTIRQWLKTLQKQGYLSTKATDPEQFIHIRGIENCLIRQRKNNKLSKQYE